MRRTGIGAADMIARKTYLRATATIAAAMLVLNVAPAAHAASASRGPGCSRARCLKTHPLRTTGMLLLRARREEKSETHRVSDAFQ